MVMLNIDIEDLDLLNDERVILHVGLAKDGINIIVDGYGNITVQKFDKVINTLNVIPENSNV